MHPAVSEIDLLISNATEIATPRGNEPRGEPTLGAIDVATDSAIAIDRGRVVAVGRTRDCRGFYRARRELDARGGIVVPGFVDAHTHPVFAGTREDEFEMRARGATYLEIAQAGGGILSSVRGVRSASPELLL